MTQLSMLLVKSSTDVMVVGSPFCSFCFEKKTGDTILIEFPINSEDYRYLLRNGVSKGVRIKCQCPPPEIPIKEGKEDSVKEVKKEELGEVKEFSKKEEALIIKNEDSLL